MKRILLYQSEWKKTSNLCMVDTFTWFDSKKNIGYFIKCISILVKDKVERIEKEYKTTECMRHNTNFSLIIDYCFDSEYMYVLYHDHGVDLLEFGLIDMDNKSKIIGLSAIANLIAEIQKYGLIHADIKLENILIDKDGKIRLCDFESLAVSGNDNKKFGTLDYMAPEQIDGKINLTTDIWAFGVICYCVWYGEFPFNESGSNHENENEKIVSNIKTCKIPKRGGLLDNLIELCTNKDSSKRCDIEVICKCFSEINKKLL